MAPCLEQNPITGLKEPSFPERDRLSRILTGSMAIVIMVRGYCHGERGGRRERDPRPEALVLLSLVSWFLLSSAW